MPKDPDSGQPQSVLDLTRPLKMECGGGCAASTAADYIRFAQMLLNRGRLGDARLLAPKTVDFMTTNHLGPEIQNNVGAGYGFGLGFAVRLGPGVSALNGSTGDYNWGGAYGTYFWVDPREDLAFVFMSQAPGPIRVHYRQLMHAMVHQAIMD
ncbi:MAG: serine hydrolase [Alphaproteobacteria bacterium]|nr:serine hydrolase [Alphaproteobacteria bacterium]